MHAAAQGALIHVLPPLLYFLKADCLVLGAQLIDLHPSVQDQSWTACSPCRHNIRVTKETDQGHGILARASLPFHHMVDAGDEAAGAALAWQNKRTAWSQSPAAVLCY